jgi:hypothetical protein
MGSEASLISCFSGVLVQKRVPLQILVPQHADTVPLESSIGVQLHARRDTATRAADRAWGKIRKVDVLIAVHVYIRFLSQSQAWRQNPFSFP